MAPSSNSLVIRALLQHALTLLDQPAPAATVYLGDQELDGGIPAGEPEPNRDDEQLTRRLKLAHQQRRAKEAQLDGIRRALIDTGVIQEGDPYSHADLEDVIRQADLAEAHVAVTRVLKLPDGPEVEDANKPWSGQYRLGYRHGVNAAKRAVENQPTMNDREQP